MPTQLQIRRGTSAENDAFTGASGELTFDTTNNRVRVHDGATQGGYELKTETSGGDTLFADNEKAIFGAGNDLKIYHDGSHSYITDTGTGDLRIWADSPNIATSTGNKIFFGNNGAAELYYTGGAKKLATKGWGVDVTGTLTSGGLTSQIATTGRSTLATFQNTASLAAGNQATIELKNGGQAGYITAESTQANSGADLIFSSNNSSATETDKIRIAEDGDISFYEDTGTTAKFFWDASAESLGIGTSSPATSISGDAQGLAIQHANVAYMSLDNTGSSGRRYTMYSNTGGSLITYDEDAASTRMVIDSSGNLLVGQTSLNYNTIGGSISAGGTLRVCSNAFQAASFNRKTSDGDIAIFYKDGSTVGSIGSYSGDLTIGDDDIGIRFDTGTGLVPWDLGATATGGSARDAAIDIGVSSARFRDLYLSGGVYLGGTGAANKLDDYEEGTFTPTIANLTNLTGTASITRAIYTKVGNLCTIQVRISGLTITSASANSVFSATLPTAAAMDAAGTPAVMGVARGTSSSATGIVADYTGGNATQVQVVFLAETTASSGSFDIEYSLTYRTA